MKIIILIIFIFLYHYVIHNGIEKFTFKEIFKSNDIKRPLYKDDKFDKLCHIGMPSGHAETVTITCCLLYYYKYINIYSCIIIIILVSLQRIIVKKHTLIQVLFGIFFGFLYSLIYKKSFWNLFLIILLGFLLTLPSLFRIDNKIHQPVPDWVNKCMISNINKKQDINFMHKLTPYYLNYFKQDENLYLNWLQLENYLNILIDKIKKSNIKFDAVVGIKTGGAIISDYISNKLNLINYKIKIKKDNKNIINDIINKNYEKPVITEKIDDNITGMNIILLDEVVASGITMYYAIKYLEKKKANIIKPYCISHLNIIDKEFDNYKIEYATNENMFIWPWGYDN